MNEGHDRIIQPNEINGIKHCSNAVKTTKYNVLTFLPLSLLIQFKKIANIYFLIISILTFQTFSPKNPYSMALTFGFVLVCSICKELYEDLVRYRQDKQINSQIIEVYDLTHKVITPTRSQNLIVGDIIKVKENEAFPADLLFLHSSKNRGLAYINTMNLDGETSLREKRAYEVSQESLIYTQLSSFETDEAASRERAKSLYKSPDLESSNTQLFDFVNLWPERKILCDASNKSLVKWNCRVDTIDLNFRKSPQSENLGSTTAKIPPLHMKFNSEMGLTLEERMPDSESIPSSDDIRPRSDPILSSEKIESDSCTKFNSENSKSNISSKTRLNPTLDFTLVRENRTENQWDFLTVDQLLLKGCVLKNTPYIFGQVVYTGNDTKIVLNSNIKVLNKTSKVQRKMNIILFSVFAFLILICIIYSSIAYDWRVRKAEDHDYLNLDKPSQEDFGSQFGTFIVAYSHLIPISLYVALEIVKLYLAYRLSKSDYMYYETDKKYAKCRSSDLIEELAATEIIFTDKTGTLTCNEMKFVKCFIDNKIYYKERPKQVYKHNTVTEIAEYDKLPHRHEILDASLIDSDLKVKEFFELLAICHSVFVTEELPKSPEFDEELMKLNIAKSSSIKLGNEISNRLNSPSVNSDILKNIKYSATSPDELALVKASSDMNIVYVDRLQNIIKLQVKEKSKSINKTVKWIVEIPFSSERARMSLLVDREDGYFIYTKGADNVMLSRISKEFKQNNKKFVRRLKRAVNQFAGEGLRTLVMARRKLTYEEFHQWHSEWVNIKQSNAPDKEEKLAEMANRIENDFELLGASAIEDKLQDEVPKTIENLKIAGINIWVLTGDKQETAVEIGKASRLIQGDCRYLIVHSIEDLKPKVDEIYEIYKEFIYRKKIKFFTNLKNDLKKIFRNDYRPEQFISIKNLNQAKYKIRSARPDRNPKSNTKDHSHSDNSLHPLNINHLNQSHPNDNGIYQIDSDPSHKASVPLFVDTKYSKFKKFTLVLDGTTASYILSADSEIKEKFFKLGYLAESCICCRLSPSQKADLVSLAHEFGNMVTLSIGDGANDVNMIQTARIGVGISGKEGPQAAQSSDFEIAQFKYLQPLLFIYGRYGYRRICTFICYYFYKNITLVFAEIWFAIVCGFSGQIFFLDWLPMLYNIMWTSWPCMLGFAFYRDISENNCLKYPNIFGAGSCNAYFSFGIFWKWLIFAILHGTMCFWFSVLCFQEAFNDTALDGGLWFISTVSFSSVIILVSLKLQLETNLFYRKLQ